MFHSDKKIVTKSNDLIEAHYSLSLLEMQIFLYSLSLVDPFDNNCPLEYEIKIDDFIKIFNKKSKNIHSEIKKTISTKFWNSEIKIKYPETGDFKFVRLVDELTYTAKESKFKISFSKKSRKFLRNLKSRFTSYELKQISLFGSFQTIRLYEFCVCKLNNSMEKNCLFKISVEDIKKRLKIEFKYPNYNDFKRRVLQKARTEINAHSDLLIDFEEIKEGRKVVSIKFIVQRKHGTKRASYAREEEENQVGTEVEFCHDKKESSREGENFVMTKNEKTTEVPAYPPRVQNGNCTYKDSDTQTISKLSSSDNKVNTVIQKSGCDAKSHILETKGDIITEPKFCHGKKNAIEKTDSNYKNFAMAKNANGILPQTDEYEKHETLLAQMCKYNLKRKRALDLIKDYGVYACRLGIANFEKAIEFGGQIDNAAGYLTRCIENATQLVKGSDEIKAERLKELEDETLSCLALEQMFREKAEVKK